MPTSMLFIVAILAFAIAMVALWLVSDVIKKMEAKLEGFVHTYIAPIHEEIGSTNQALSRVIKDVENMTKSVATIDTMAGRITKVAEDLDKLDLSIPQRYRAGVMLSDEASKGGVTKPKK